MFQIFRGKVMKMFQFCTFISREKLSKIFWVKKKNRQNVPVLHFLAFDNFGFTHKILEIFLGEKNRENFGFALFYC